MQIPIVDTIDTIETPRFQQDESMLVFAVMGITGAGKSTFVKTITGNADIKTGEGMESCTQNVDKYQMKVGDKTFVFLDTPGFDDGSRCEADILQLLSGHLAATYEKGVKLSGLIYLHAITDCRMSGSAKRNLLLFNKLCGHRAFENVILATTKWDLVSSEMGELREKELQDKYWKEMLETGSKMFRFNKTRESALDIVAWLEPKTRVVMEIQRELVDEKKELRHTDAGKFVQSKILGTLQTDKQELGELREQLEEIHLSYDQGSDSQILERELKKREKKLEAEIRKLNADAAKLEAKWMGIASGVVVGASAVVVAGVIIARPDLALVIASRWARVNY